ncbi:MAG: diguanylate cyclase [Deltaproteobacteria bacterium]|nr:diguanylate cyclase [Deltaproteobacteria bacterium]
MDIGRSILKRGTIIPCVAWILFVGISFAIQLEAAGSLAEVMLSNVRNMKISHEKSPPSGVVTISLGVASAIGSATPSFEAVLHESDKALYRAKEKGRDRVEILDGTPP